MVKEIPLQNGMVALVDDEDYENVMKHVWWVSTNKWSTQIRNKHDESLARFVLYVDKGDKRKVTFKDGDALNNQKENLVLVEQSMLLAKSRGHRDGSSKYKGVCWDKRSKKWISNITVNKKRYYLGSFDDEDEAAMVYNKAAIELIGESSYLNEIGKDNSSESPAKFEKVRQQRYRSAVGFKGVYKNYNKYEARIIINSKDVYIGLFGTPEEAAEEYDKKAYESYGDKAILNFPENLNEYQSKK